MIAPEKNPVLLSKSKIPLANTWPRFFARTFDIYVEIFFIGFLWGVALELLGDSFATWLITWLQNNERLLLILTLPLGLTLDALLYKIAGNTPGKALLGLKVLTLDYKPLKPFQYLKRNFSMWLRGLGLGIPIIQFFTMIYQACRISDGKQTSYDESTEFRVLQLKSLGFIRKITYILASVSIFAIILMGYSIELEQQNNLSSVLESYSLWENPHTRLKTNIDARWNHSRETNTNGTQSHKFLEPTNHVVIMLTSAEAAANDTLEDYVNSVTKDMNFPDKGYFFKKNGYRLWQGSAIGVVEGSKNRMSMQIVQVGQVFFGIITIQAPPYAYSDIFSEKLRVALWSTFPKPR